jgi:hypothetical protein
MHFHFYRAQLAVLVEVNARGRKKEGGAFPDNRSQPWSEEMIAGKVLIGHRIGYLL